MSTTLIPTAPNVTVVTEEELRHRLSVVTSKLEERFGCLEQALEHERNWMFDDDEGALFSEYHAVKFLLAE